MNDRMRRNRLGKIPSGIVLPLVLVFAGGAACATKRTERQVMPVVSSEASSPGAEGPMTGASGEIATTIGTNTQATIGEVRIGAGNFNEGDSFVDEGGQRRKGNTCALWIFVLQDDGGQTTSTIRVHAGQTFDAGTKHFTVKNVKDGAVELVSRPKAER